MGEFYIKMVSIAAAGLAIALGVLGPALGMGKIGSSALESMARQPEVSGKTFTTMLVAMALVEALAIYCLLVSLAILFANPYV